MPPIKFADRTKVSAAQTLADIRQLLERAGCEGFGYMEEGTARRIQFKLSGGRLYQLAFKVPTDDDQWGLSAQQRGQRTRTTWRTIALMLKAKLVAVAEDVLSEDEAFFPHVLLPNGTTIQDVMSKPENLDKATGGRVMQLLPGPV